MFTNSAVALSRLGLKVAYIGKLGNDENGLKILDELKNKIKICFNPSNYLCEYGNKYLKNILKNTKILVLNEEESSLLAGKGKPLKKIKSLKKLGPEIAIITDGKNPVHGANGSGSYFKIFPQNIKVVDATGAGDSFSSSFLAGMIETADMELSLKLAIANSHSVLKFKGSKKRLYSILLWQ